MRRLTVADRRVEPGDTVKIPGTECIITIVSESVSLRDNWQSVIIRVDGEAYNHALYQFHYREARRVMGAELEYVSRADGKSIY